MKILIAHNYYRRRGGEDVIFEQETALLRAAGHDVRTVTRHNDEITAAGVLGRAIWAHRSLHNHATARQLHALLRGWRPDVAHLHNLHPLLSPAVYAVLHRHGIPTVQSIHNYRWFCIAGTFFRNGRPCEDCFRRRGGRLHGLWRRCYRDSFGASAVLTMVQEITRWRVGPATHRLAHLLVNTDFVRAFFLEAGFPDRQIALHPNFLDAPPPAAFVPREGPVLYAGRLDEPKGVAVFLRAAMLLPNQAFEVIGDGPARPDLERQARREGADHVLFRGALPGPACRERMAAARAVVIPSLWYESFPMVLLESFAAGTPVIAARIGSLATLIRDRENGMGFEPGHAADLARRIRELINDPALCRALAERGAEELRTCYAPESALARLEKFYRTAAGSPGGNGAFAAGSPPGRRDRIRWPLRTG